MTNYALLIVMALLIMTNCIDKICLQLSNRALFGQKFSIKIFFIQPIKANAIKKFTYNLIGKKRKGLFGHSMLSCQPKNFKSLIARFLINERHFFAARGEYSRRDWWIQAGDYLLNIFLGGDSAAKYVHAFLVEKSYLRVVVNQLK